MMQAVLAYIYALPMLTVLLLLVFIFLSHKKTLFDSIRLALLYWSVLVVGVVEILSPFRFITRQTLIIFWIGMVLGLLFWIIKTKVHVRLPPVSVIVQNKPLNIFILTICLFVSIQLVIALLSPPNNSDSMTYHMSRVFHWEQNKGVFNYPTHIQRQLYQAPLGEFIVLNFYTLMQNDYLALFSQWLFFIGCICTIPLLAKKIGATGYGQIIAVAFLVTLPIGILQATSAQNNYILAFMILNLINSLFDYFPNPTSKGLLEIGLFMGLSLLTKGTAYLYVFPFLIFFCIKDLLRIKAKSIRNLALVAVIVVGLNINQWTRNYTLFHSPLGPSTEGRGAEYMNYQITVQGLLSNIYKNVLLHVGTTGYIDRRLEIRAKQVHNLLLGFELQTEKYSWGLFFIPELKFRHEDLSGNVLHMGIILTALIIIAFSRGRNLNFYIYLGCVICGFLLFCLILRWQPWHTRLHLPVFAMLAPVVGVVFQKYKKLVFALLLIFFIGSLPYLLKNDLHAILGKHSIFSIPRSSQYFTDSKHLEASYVAVAEFVKEKNPDVVGLVWGGDDWEYPLLQLMPYNTFVTHINIDNNPSMFLNSGLIPEIILVRGVNRGRETDSFVFNGKEYTKKLETTHVSLFSSI